MAKNILNKLLDKRITQLKAKAKTKTLTAATPTVDDPTLQTWIKEVSSTVKDIASSGVRRSDLVRAGIATITNGELQNALSPPEEVNLTVPAAVLNLTANGAYSSNTLTWETRPSKFFGQNNIYRSDVDDFGTATHIGSTLGDVYTDYVGNNIKAYYWVRTISKFGVEGELSPSVYAETAIDVAYVMEQIEGQINESHLNQILRGEINSISQIQQDLLAEAQARADAILAEAQARVTALNNLAATLDNKVGAVTADLNLKAADLNNRITALDGEISQEVATLDERVTQVKAGIDQDISGLNNGLTQEIQNRIDGDATVTTALNAYKLSNDNAVATVLNKAETAISGNSATASEVTALKTRMTTTEDTLTKKVDSTAFNTLNSKVTTIDNKVNVHTSEISSLSAEIDTIDAKAGTALTSAANAQTTADAAVSENTALSQRVDNLVASLSGDGTETTVDAAAFNVLKVEVESLDGEVTTNTSNISSLSGRMTNAESGISGNTSAINSIKTTQTAQGGKINQAVEDISALQNSLSLVKGNLTTKADANTVSQIRTDLTATDQRVTANTDAINQHTSRLNTVEGAVSTKLEASAINNYYTKTESDNKATTIAAGEVSKFDASLVIGGVNLLDHRENAWSRGSVGESKASGSSYAQLKIGVTTRIICNDLVPLDSKPFVVSVQNPEYTCCLVLFDSSGGYLGLRSGFKTYSNVHKIGAIAGGGYVGVVIRRADDGAIIVSEATLAKVKIEYGTKETTWSAADSVIQSELAANASAIQATNTEVSRIDGVVTSQASSISKLQSDLSTTDTKANTAINNAATAQQTANTAVTAGQANASNLVKLESTMSVMAESVTANGSQATVDIIGMPSENVLLSANPDSMTGSVIKLKGYVNAGVTNSKMLIDPTKLYKLRMRFRRTSGETNRIFVAVINHNATGDRTVTAMNGLNLEGQLINSTNYPISNELPALNSWREVTYYFKGKSTGASTGAGTLTNPRTFPALAATADIGVLANYQKGNDLTQEYEIDYLIFEDATNEAANDANATALQAVDTRVTNVDGKVTANSNSILNLNSRMSTAEGNISKKADATVLNDYYTKTQADAQATTIAAGEVSKFDASLVIGGVNQLVNSEDARVGFNEYLLYERSAHLRQFYEDNLGKPITISCEMMVPVAGYVQIYSSNASAHLYNAMTPQLTADVWTKVVVTVSPTRKSDFETKTMSTLEFYGVYNTGRKVSVRKVQLEAGNKATDWSLSPRDTQASLDANASAIQATNTEVTRINGVVSSHTTQLTNLNASIAGKADTTALNALTARVAAEEGKSSSQASSITNLQSSLSDTDKIAKDALPKIGGAGSFKTFKEVLNYFLSTAGTASNIVIETPITFAANMFRISGKGYNYASTKSVIDFEVSGYAYRSGGYILQHGARNVGTFPMRIRLGMKDDKLCVILSPKGTNFAYPSFTVDAAVSYGAVSDTFKDGWSASPITEAELASYGITAIMEPSLLDVSNELEANATATSTLDTKVTNINGVVNSHATQLTQLSTSVGSNTTKISEQTTTIDGIKGIKTVTIDNNGVMSGYGLVSQLVNGQVTSAFGVNADTFFIGSPANNKKPFAVLGSSGLINGVSVPAGTYIDTAYIPNGTITNAKIGNLSADKITAGNIAADRMKANIVAAVSGQFTSLSAITGTIGVLRTATSGARTEIKDNLIEVYDSAGNVRVRLGVW